MSQPDRLTKPTLPKPGGTGPETGPLAPDVRKPSGENELMKRMKKIDPDQAKKYRQRSGQ